jgi:hypothetical protein
MTHLKVLMQETAEFCLVGDDDSGPEDAEDDLDLECASPQLQKTVNANRLFFQYVKRAIF